MNRDRAIRPPAPIAGKRLTTASCRLLWTVAKRLLKRASRSGVTAALLSTRTYWANGQISVGSVFTLATPWDEPWRPFGYASTEPSFLLACQGHHQDRSALTAWTGLDDRWRQLLFHHRVEW